MWNFIIVVYISKHFFLSKHFYFHIYSSIFFWLIFVIHSMNVKFLFPKTALLQKVKFLYKSSERIWAPSKNIVVFIFSLFSPYYPAFIYLKWRRWRNVFTYCFSVESGSRDEVTWFTWDWSFVVMLSCWERFAET